MESADAGGILRWRRVALSRVTPWRNGAPGELCGFLGIGCVRLRSLVHLR